jgi:hypothetical protein
MRAWRRLQATPQGHASARIVSYNILGDGARLALSPKHAYCPIELREWPGRCLRLAREAAEYEADIICLQECSLRAFTQLEDAINSAAGGAGLRYQGVHCSQCIQEPGSEAEKKRCANACGISPLQHAPSQRSVPRRARWLPVGWWLPGEHPRQAWPSTCVSTLGGTL